MDTIQGLVFDLDGVLVDTAELHFEAWGRLVQSLGGTLSREQNESLKGVSRAESLNRILGMLNLELDSNRRDTLAEKKNLWYQQLIAGLTPKDVLPGVNAFLNAMEKLRMPMAVGSASQNAGTILRQTGLIDRFEAIIDGTITSKAKPDPEVFLLAAAKLGLEPANCLVFEDAQAGVFAARNAGMKVVGIGRPDLLKGADLVVSGFLHLNENQMQSVGIERARGRDAW